VNRARRWRLGIFIGVLLIHLAALYSPSTGGTERLFAGVDKVTHIVLFAIVVWAGCRAGFSHWIVVAVFAAHAPVSELVQRAALPSRQGSWGDVAADTAGIVVGFVIVNRSPHARATSRVSAT
jgi:VanZ family protein